MIMRKLLLIFCMVFAAVAVSAQGNKGQGKDQKAFDPQKFEQQLEQYVVKGAGFTQAEAAKFLPLFRELRKKTTAIMEANAKKMKGRPTTEQECADAMKGFLESEVQLKKIEQTYTLKMLKVVPATKLIKVKHAEEEFHREAFRKVQESQRGKGMGHWGGPRRGLHNGGPQGNKKN